jgi:DNA (cytosine-5)-methyltransferase 1
MTVPLRPLVVGSLFAGIGGFDLAARWMGWRTAWFSEVDPLACAVLDHHWPGVPNHGDIRQIDFTTVEPVDVLVAGFPCQDISHAGKKKGLAGPQSSLWGECLRAIRTLRPRYCVVENSAALVRRGLDGVLGGLAACGYDAEWRLYGASDVGAPHRRERCWIIGTRPWEPIYDFDDFTLCESCEDWWCPRCGCHAGDCGCLTLSCMGDGWDAADTPWGTVAYPTGERGRSGDRAREDAADADAPAQAAPPDARRRWWTAEPAVDRLVDGIPRRVAQLRALGNAVVPQCVLPIYERIAHLERQRVTAW